MTDSLTDFQKETYFCDYSNSHIQKIANNFKQKYSNQPELAKELFYFVRDNTHYKVGNWNKRASETLAKKGGTCTNNANLLIALLRCVGIPAGYGVMEVIGPDYFGPIGIPKFVQFVSKKSKHIYCYIYLNNKWVKCDPSDDEALSLNTQHFNPQSKIVEWNGISDAMLNLNPTHVISDIGPLADIDHIIRKRQRRALYFPVKIANLYIDFLREHGKKIQTADMIEVYFEKWLRKYHKFYYAVYKIFICGIFYRVEQEELVKIDI